MLYPTDENVKDYLCWRQVRCEGSNVQRVHLLTVVIEQTDAHINNLYNTAFWELVRS